MFDLATGLVLLNCISGAAWAWWKINDIAARRIVDLITQ